MICDDECLEGSVVNWIGFLEIVNFLPCIVGDLEAFQPVNDAPVDGLAKIATNLLRAW
jgi:hypothetical protein